MRLRTRSHRVTRSIHARDSILLHHSKHEIQHLNEPFFFESHLNEPLGTVNYFRIQIMYIKLRNRCFRSLRMHIPSGQSITNGLYYIFTHVCIHHLEMSL